MKNGLLMTALISLVLLTGAPGVQAQSAPTWSITLNGVRSDTLEGSFFEQA